MDFYDRLLLYKSKNKLGYRELGAYIGLKDAAMRMAVTRKTLSGLQIRELEEVISEERDHNLDESETNYHKNEKLTPKFKGKRIVLDETIIESRSGIDALVRFLNTHHQDLMQDPMYSLFMGNITKQAIIEYEKERIRKKAIGKNSKA